LQEIVFERIVERLGALRVIAESLLAIQDF